MIFQRAEDTTAFQPVELYNAEAFYPAKEAHFQNLILEPFLVVLIACELDKPLVRPHSHLMEGTTYFVKLKLKWTDTQEELENKTDVKETFRTRDLKLFPIA